MVPSEDREYTNPVDGGTTWTKSLYVDNKTGCSELSMDMNNPRILYATMWEHGRLPWKVISGGPEVEYINLPMPAQPGKNPGRSA